MINYFLSAATIDKSRASHRSTQDKCEADRIRAMVLLGTGGMCQGTCDIPQPHRNPVLACAWIKRGEEQEVKTNNGRGRVNINGAIHLAHLVPVVRFDDTMDAALTQRAFRA